MAKRAAQGHHRARGVPIACALHKLHLRAEVRALASEECEKLPRLFPAELKHTEIDTRLIYVREVHLAKGDGGFGSVVVTVGQGKHLAT